MIDPKKLAGLKHGTPAWHAERRRVEQFLNARCLMLRTQLSRGTFESVNEVVEDLYLTLDEVVQLAGCER